MSPAKMKPCDDLLVEILTEELPPKALLPLAQAFSEQLVEGLQKAGLTFSASNFFATPRRLAVFVQDLVATQKDQTIERRGPALNAAYDKQGHPTPACVGFARSCGVEVDQLHTITTPQGKWVGVKQHVPGKSVMELLPEKISQALAALPIAKRMRWGQGEVSFVRPVHAVVLLYGDQVVPGVILGCETGRTTRGHRFHAPEWITIPHASQYASLLETQGHVIADFVLRHDMMLEGLKLVLEKQLGDEIALVTKLELSYEVAGLVEWPVPLCGQFDTAFLSLPEEILIAAMIDHQRYFPIRDQQGKLMPYFAFVSNIQSHDVKRVIHGNERVLRARLSDAAFFYAADKKEKLEQRVDRLHGMLFQAKLGSLHAKTERLQHIATYLAGKMNVDPAAAKRAALLAKTDLTTQAVGEFPELQGVMGRYYAKEDGEAPAVCEAMEEHYLPRFAGDSIPKHALGRLLAIADRLDTLVGVFGINQHPSGDKDPYGLRRAALGVLRILIEGQLDLDLSDVVDVVLASYQIKLDNAETKSQLLHFMQERLRSWYQEQGISPDVFAAVAALGITNPLDVDKRIKAVQAFKNLSEAETLCMANKRVSNILAKYTDAIEATAVDARYFQHGAENELAQEMQAKQEQVTRLYQAKNYEAVLLQLASLHQPIAHFFDEVMVMTEDKKQRENRLLLLSQLRALFLQVADIALLNM